LLNDRFLLLFARLSLCMSVCLSVYPEDSALVRCPTDWVMWSKVPKFKFAENH